MTFARLKSERGQAFFLTAAVMLFVGLGMAALVLDVGNWFHDKRRLQGTVDAAALAGAQQLPDDSAAAQSQAVVLAGRPRQRFACAEQSSAFGGVVAAEVGGFAHLRDRIVQRLAAFALQ